MQPVLVLAVLGLDTRLVVAVQGLVVAVHGRELPGLVEALLGLALAPCEALGLKHLGGSAEM